MNRPPPRIGISRVSLALLVGALAASSGCISSCGYWETRAEWQQPGLEENVRGAMFKVNGTSASAFVYENGSVYLSATRDDRYPSEDELHEAGRHVFQRMGWPEPTFTAAKVSHTCADHL